MEKYMKALGYDLKGFTVSCLQMMFGHVYYIWRVLKPELGHDKALQTYGDVWHTLALALYQQGVEALGIKEVKDVPTLGRIFDFCWSACPSLYETVENTPDRHVGRVLWCPNAEYGPHDCHLHRQEYYRSAEVPLTLDPFLSTWIAEAKKMGLEGDVEVAVPEGMCRDGNAGFCQIHIWRKGSPKVEPEIVPDSEKRWVETDMGDEEPILYCLRKQGKKLEDFGPGTLVSVVFTDMSYWDALEANLDKGKALALYKKLWLVYPPMWVKEARLELEIGRATKLEELARIIAFCEGKRFVPYEVVSGKDNQISLVGSDDPFAEIPTQFLGRTMEAHYLQVVAETDQEFVDKVIAEAKMADRSKATVKKKLVKGDERNEIVIEKK